MSAAANRVEFVRRLGLEPDALQRRVLARRVKRGILNCSRRRRSWVQP